MSDALLAPEEGANADLKKGVVWEGAMNCPRAGRGEPQDPSGWLLNPFEREVETDPGQEN